MTQKSVYISGKITGTIDLNKFKFRQAENHLRNFYGDEAMIINPHTILHLHDKSWEMYMREDVRAMLKCSCVFVLDDWKQSRGAITEVLLASYLGMPILELTWPEKELIEVNISNAMRLWLRFKLFLMTF